jgi:DNA mismatch endonuclease (patch repair protein)
MTDIWDKQKRSEVMSKIRSKDTKPELALRKALFARGFRYRMNDTKLPGKPDIVLPKYKTVIFVHGCFWHGHEREICKYAIDTPKTNIEYWTKKIASNKKRDSENILRISSMGWNILTIWECEIMQKSNIDALIERISNFLHEHHSTKIPKRISVKFYEEIGNDIMMVAEDIVPYQRTKK